MFKVYCILALRDLWHDRYVSWCMITALMAVIAPLLLLFGLKQGVVNQLQHELTKKPNLLEIKTQGNTHNLSQDWIQAVQKRPDVHYAIGLTRSLNAEAAVFKTLNAAKHETKNPLYSEIIPTSPGDPLLADQNASIDNNHFAISYSLAQRLNVQASDLIFFRFTRTHKGEKTTHYVQATISAVLEPHVYARPATFVPLNFLIAIENFMDGLQEQFAIPQTLPPKQSFANVRIYAQNTQDVLTLSQWLEEQHIRTHSQQAAIHNNQMINSVLSLIFAVIAITAIVGGSISLAGSFLTNIDRKRQLIATLRLLGINKINIVYYIGLQVFFITTVSYILALLFYFIGSTLFNQSLNVSQQLANFSTYLNLKQLFFAFLITSALVIVVAFLGSYQAMRIDPAESLREI